MIFPLVIVAELGFEAKHLILELFALGTCSQPPETLQPSVPLWLPAAALHSPHLGSPSWEPELRLSQYTRGPQQWVSGGFWLQERRGVHKQHKTKALDLHLSPERS